MNQKIVNFGIELPRDCFTHDEEHSCYANNYYKMRNYGDWLYGDYTHLKINYDECSNTYEYALGSFDKQEKFHAIIYWHTNEWSVDILDI